MQKNVRKNLRDIIGGIACAWAVFYAAIHMDPHLLALFAEHGISPAALAALLAADAVLVLSIFAVAVAAALFLAKAGLRLARHCVRRSA